MAAHRLCLLVLLPLLLLLLPAARAEPPTCTKQFPLSAERTEVQGTWAEFKVYCAAPQSQKDLAKVGWSLDGVPEEPVNTTSSEVENVDNGFHLLQTGDHYIRAWGINTTGGAGPPVLWVVHVLPSNGSVDPTASGPEAAGGSGTATPSSGFPPRLNPIEAFSALVGAVVGVGGLALAVVQYRRNRGRAQGEPATGIQVRQSVGTNTGTVIGQAEQVVLQAPAPVVPPGVPPHKQALYLSLARAHDALDRLPVSEATLEARELVGDLMGKLARGEIPVRESRRPAAAAVAHVLEGTVPPAEQAVLADAAAGLRR